MLNHFNFKMASSGRLLITNDFGEYAFLTPEEFLKLVKGNVDAQSQLHETLKQRKYILDEADLISAEVAEMLRESKHHVFAATSLHIFVVSGGCNLRCRYCQAQAHGGRFGLMDAETARKAVDIALQSPSPNLTFEFQGGEPLLNFPVIREIVEYAEQQATGKHIEFTIVSNLSLLTEDILEFFIAHNVSISTSLDGPQAVHDYNRPHLHGQSSYDLLVKGVSRIRQRGYSVSAIETTTRRSLGSPREIVREHVRMGLNAVFLRPLSPLGFAAHEWEEIGYTPGEYLAFYREAFDEVLAINKKGTFFFEQQASIFLRKILLHHGLNYMDLRSPCGAGIGQLAYYHDGNIYTCDEGRMVAESGDSSFRLGNVNTSTYQDLVSNRCCDAVCTASVTESLPGCCDCAYQPYCGVCPVISYASHDDIFPRYPHDYRCTINEGILDFLFDLIDKSDESNMHIFESWITT